jgi:hypothetical protein
MTTRGDGLRERDRYGRASLREQLGGELRALRGQPGLILVLGLVIGGGAFLVLSRPQLLRVTDLATGDCLYIRAADAVMEAPPGRRIGSDAAVVDALYATGAERAACDMSHSHEVAGRWQFEDLAAVPYPGAGALQDRRLADCQAAFAAYVGHPAQGSQFEFVVAVPTEDAWNDAIRAGACLVERNDGGFMDRPARGSGS